ncbi:putative uncharacterized protein [Collinsella sp. CAG:289]|nr:putative uncharacterized protein [Collinsella sp. CAG:289]
MRVALDEAALAAQAGEVPIGATVVFEGRVIARAHNRRELDKDPSAHAEFLALLEAARVLGRWRLTGCTVYVTLEPCLMCAGLMVNSRIDRCVFGAPDPKGGAVGSLYDLSRDNRLNHGFEVTSGVLQDECSKLLQGFFSQLRDGTRASALSREEAPLPCCCPNADEAQLGPRVLLAIDSFKGCATSAQIEDWVEEGVLHAAPGAQVEKIAIADGGEGTCEAVHRSLGGELVETKVEGPLGSLCQARYLFVDDEGTTGPFAVIELAQADGITQSSCTYDAALDASTFGVGQLIVHALDRGATSLYIGLGGSASTDGGVGLLMALGAHLFDEAGGQIGRGLRGLENLASIDLSPALERLRNVSVSILNDVTNPLVGARGAARIFGPQKGLCAQGAPADALDLADANLVRYGRLLTQARDAHDGGALQVGEPGARPRSLMAVPGAGAAGGTGAALLALGARMSSGIETMLDLVGFDDAAAHANLIITGEGNLDNQTAAGKAPVGVAKRAKAAGKPVVAIVGGRADDIDEVYRAGIDLVVPLAPRPLALECALDPAVARENARIAGDAAVRAYLL